jgi:hypothetical protein
MIKQTKKCHRRSVIGKKLSGMCHEKKVSINVTGGMMQESAQMMWHVVWALVCFIFLFFIYLITDVYFKLYIIAHILWWHDTRLYHHQRVTTTRWWVFFSFPPTMPTFAITNKLQQLVGEFSYRFHTWCQAPHHQQVIPTHWWVFLLGAEALHPCRLSYTTTMPGPCMWCDIRRIGYY